LGDSTIGIKIADGSYYPVLEQGFTGRKKLTLTTIADDQRKVQIDLYRGDGGGLTKARYIGSLVLENIPAAPKGEPEIELFIGMDPEGKLSAEASDRSTGESQRLAIKLETFTEEDTYMVPQFEIEDENPQVMDFEEPPLTGETYPVGEEDRRKDRGHRRGPNFLLLILFVIVGVLLVAAIAYLVYRNLKGPTIPSISGASTSPAAARQETGDASTTGSGAATAAPSGSAKKAPSAGGTAKVAASGAPSGAKPTSTAGKGGVNYRIKRGDTLWDIASSYYRNPWLYPRLAKANSIKNPDLILAGTRIIIPED
jgi:LysM repeat protein